MERVIAPKANTRFCLSERFNLARVYSHILYFSSKVTVSFGYGSSTQRPHWRRGRIKEQPGRMGRGSFSAELTNNIFWSCWCILEGLDRL